MMIKGVSKNVYEKVFKQNATRYGHDLVIRVTRYIDPDDLRDLIIHETVLRPILAPFVETIVGVGMYRTSDYEHRIVKSPTIRNTNGDKSDNKGICRFTNDGFVLPNGILIPIDLNIDFNEYFD